jgi:toxin ParE1/3/4
MSKHVKRTHFIDADTNGHADFIAEDNVDAAIRYLRAANTAMQSLGDHPTRGSLYRTTNPKLKGLRRLAVPGFKNYLIFYYDRPTHVEIVRVLHGARDIPSILSEVSH